MVSLLNTRYNRPVQAFGNPEDPRETDADAVFTTAIALLRGILHATQSPIGGPVTTATLTAVASATSSTLLAAANTARKALFVYNSDANPLFVKYGTAATTTTSFTVKIPPDGYWEMPAPVYTGVVHGIWSVDGSGHALVTEV